MTTLLVMTVGQTDVQLVVSGQRHKLDGNNCGTLHDAIKSRSWSVVDTPKDRNRKFITELPEGGLLLCTPKLDAVLAHFAPSLPTSVLILETRRQDSRDPRFAGEVMERRLRDRSLENVTRVAFLTGDEQLEDPSNEVDAVVRRSVVAKLSHAIGPATEKLEPDDRVFVATTGGLAAANELINELVRLHAVGGPTVTALEVPDGERTGQDDRAVEEKFHPAAGYRARWQALSLVEKGNLLGAWGAVSHLEDVPGQEWTKIIKCLAHFASSLPLPENCDLAVLSHECMAVRTALRVEFALRAGDIPRAIHGTVAFFESALWDMLLEHFERHPCSQRSRSYKIKDGSNPIDEKLIRKADCSRDNEKRPFKIAEIKDGVTWYNIFDNDACAVRIAKHYLKSCHLKKLGQAVSNVRDLRNDVAHNEPTPALMEAACEHLVEWKLWSKDKYGMRFLPVDLVQNIIAELGEHNAENLYADLMATVRERLLALPEGTK